MTDAEYWLEQALASAHQMRIATGGGYEQIEALEAAIERAKNPAFKPVFGSPAAPPPPPPAPPPPPPAPPVYINVRAGTGGVYTGPKPRK